MTGKRTPKYSAQGAETACTGAYTYEAILASVQELSAAGASLRRIAAERFAGRVTYGTLARMLKGKEPVEPEIRRALGIVDPIPVMPCAKCGEVHVTRNCRKNARRRVRWSDLPLAEMPVELLRWKLENREVL